ncbi:MAG TPA: Uma2 family endonuclease [Kofleriaceae bacterium]|nr:Uma2 family endonuclease [Kofleriaceae bacterium]
MPAAKLATYDDLLAFTDPEDKRAELIHGVIVERVGPSGQHSNTQGRLFGYLMRRFERSQGQRWPGGWWFGTECDMQYETHEVFCHDLIGWRRDRMAGRPEGRPQRLRPDWACEIISPSTEKHDFIDKMPVLHRANVPYFWIVRPIEKTLLVHRWTPDGYVVRNAAASGDVIRAEPFDAVELRVAVIFGDEDDEE